MSRTTRPPPWTDAERALLDRIASPEQVQAMLDETPYSTDPIYRCPRSVLRDRRAHCFDGAVLAAAAFQHGGLAPRIIDLRAHRDDDHVVAVFQRHGAWGAVGKSNCVGLRWREPVYRTLRELVMSYFDEYYNLERERSLRSFTLPLNLRRFDKEQWKVRDEALEVIASHLDRARHVEVATPEMIAALQPVDPRRYDAGLMGSNPAGLYKPWDH